MLLRILHTTTYRYHGSVDMAQHMVHLSPVDTPCQVVEYHALRIAPEPAARHQTTDVFGNLRTFFSLQAPHETLSVEADSRVNTHVPRPIPCKGAFADITWERARNRFLYRAGAPYDAASEFLFASPMVPRDHTFSAFARPAFYTGLPLLQAAAALMALIHTELEYKPASTGVNTPALQALHQGQGVCQDFAHIMIGCLRSLGLPARYVSGYLLTQPPPGQPRLIGADASHAWVSVYAPRPGSTEAIRSHERRTGEWFHFDPTNNRAGWGSPGEDYVVLATGRDFSDVSPMRGVIQGGAGHTLEVGVTVAPPEDIEALQET